MTVSDIPDDLRAIAAKDTPLWSITSMRVGGPARWLLRPASVEALRKSMTWAQANGDRWMLLGAGTNVIFPDSGFSGIVIATQSVQGSHVDGVRVTVSCGEPLAGVAGRMSSLGLSGLEWAVGIPGTVGGGVATNAGAYGADMASVLDCVTLATADAVVEMRADELGLAYRTSAIRFGDVTGVILRATLRLREDQAQRCRKRAEAYAEQRRSSQPSGASAGCIFKNPVDGPAAGEMLDRAGCKGLRVGHAVVSEQHANFIINEGRNNAADVLRLIEHMHDRVRRTFGIDLTPEVEIIGL